MKGTNSEYLFEIDFDQWALLKDSETGLLKDPVPAEEFEVFEYWCDEYHKPVRQVIPKDGDAYYADFLNLRTCKLERRVSLTLGWSAYDDEISKEKYEELCQVALLKYHYNKHVDSSALVPHHRLNLGFWRLKDELIIYMTREAYHVNCEEKKVKKFRQFNTDMLNSATRISEYEFYHSIIRRLLKIDENILIDET